MNQEHRWDKQKIWDWYQALPWMRGCNYLPADCCNRIAMWQSLDFKQHLETMDRELTLARSVGFNSMRIIVEFDVWRLEHDNFLSNFEQVLELGNRHGIRFLVCLSNDCVPPRDRWRPVHLGKQAFDLGYHGGKKITQHSDPSRWQGVGYYPAFDEPDLRREFFAMVTELVSLYGQDSRILIWDLMNEPGFGRREDISAPHLKRLFEVVRELHPSQPLTACIWRSLDALSSAEKIALEQSDIISYHNYSSYAYNVTLIHDLQHFGRPVIVTEWLHRLYHNNVAELFPLFFLNKIGCWNWGFVAGQSQTHEPWESIWEHCETGNYGDIDFTKWQHDLFRPSLRPYDPREIDLIKQFCALADRDYASQQHG